MKNIVILISGRGSNMEAVVRRAKPSAGPPVLLPSSATVPMPRAGFAAEHGIPTAVVANKDYASRAEFDAALQTVIDGFAPDLVVLAGFMRILTPPFVEHYAGRMLNIHPSLLPLFPGWRRTGRHWAGVRNMAPPCISSPPNSIMADGGAGAVPVMPDDTVDTLSARVLKQEHVIYPRAVRWFVEDRLTIVQGAVQVDHSK
jgi:phosphoribosylglycinamide formyltransferase-1